MADSRPAPLRTADAGNGQASQSILSLLDDALVAAGALHSRTSHAPYAKAVEAAAAAAPELLARTSHAVDLRARLYGLGVVLYEMATGRPPFSVDDPLRQHHAKLAYAPVPPIAVRPDLPEAFSAIVMRLLEKEPERRYQTTEGVVHDLARLKRALQLGEPATFAPGEFDFASRLGANPVLVGRETELAHLEDLFSQAARGRRSVALVRGGAGIGKSSLVNALRPHVAVRDGWIAVGKFEQYGSNDAAVIAQLLGALGMRLLAEPEAVLASDKQRITAQLGPKAVAVCAIPEFRLLLGELRDNEASDPAHSEVRLAQAVMDIAAAIASAARPLMLVMEDLQWAGSAGLRLLDRILNHETLAHVMLVGTFRDTSLPGSELESRLAKWQALPLPPTQVALQSMHDEQVALLLADMLRLPSAHALDLARTLAPHTGGNPYNTLEFVNTLRDDGLLARSPSGWAWEAAAIQRYVGKADVVDLLGVRIARLDPDTRAVLQGMACIGHECTFGLARAVTGMTEEELSRAAMALVDEGLLVEEPAAQPLLRIRHDRAQESALLLLEPAARVAMHLAIARRLASLPQFVADAASQYLAAADAVTEAGECASVASLLRKSAARERDLASHASARHRLETALVMLQRARAAGNPDDAVLADCEIELHESLYVLGRLDEADAVFQRIEAREKEPLRIAQAVCWQIASLNSRARPGDGLALGVSWLSRMGVWVPPAFERDAVMHEFNGFRAWVEAFDAQREHARKKASSPEIAAIAKVLVRVGQPAGVAWPWAQIWAANECRKLWEQHGPCAPLAVGISRMGQGNSHEFADGSAAHAAVRHMLHFAEDKGWDYECAHIREIHCNTLHFFEPMDRVPEEAARSREGLVAAGDLYLAYFARMIGAAADILCAERLELAERSCLECAKFARNAGLNHFAVMSEPPLRFVELARGTRVSAGDVGTDVPPALLERFTQSALYKYSECLFGVLACAMSEDVEGLDALSHTPALKDLGFSLGLLPVIWGRGLSATWRVRTSPAPGSDKVTASAAQAREVIAMFQRHAGNAPSNYRPLYLHLEAELAWAQGRTVDAQAHFDTALESLEGLPRPFFRAFITERFGRFQLVQGWSAGGRRLIGEAQALYAYWGATAKARSLAPLAGSAEGQPLAAADHSGAPDELDAAALLRASQVLASERNLATLRARVEEVLRNIAGATHVQLVQWNEERNGWDVHDPAEPDAPGLDADAAQHLVPLSALRYVQRTTQPLLAQDAFADDRFARDPYFRGMDRCSLMVVPILHQRAPLAILVLENRAARAAFGPARLDAVVLIAGQLAVSLESAKLYEKLEEKVALQTRELRQAQSRLVAEARRSGMAQIATNVLHNVGNLLNSVNVSAHVVDDRLRHAPETRLADLAALLQRPADELSRYLTEDDRGRVIPGYLGDLSKAVARERELLLAELQRLQTNVGHIQNVIATQQSYAGVGGVLEVVPATEVMEDALRMHSDLLEREQVVVVRHYGPVDAMALDKTRLMQILVNLIDNACDAMETCTTRRLEVRVSAEEGGVTLAVSDNGCGMAPEQLKRVFSHGFTTKAGGHGFGLHSCAVAAREMGGSLAVHSNGPGSGASFTLALPVGGHGKAPRQGGSGMG